MTTLSKQAAAIAVARQIMTGAVSMPKPTSEQRRMLAEHLRDAEQTIRNSEGRAA